MVEHNHIEQAVKELHGSIRDAVKARDGQYRFLAHAVLAHRDGQQDPQGYEQRLTARLKRRPRLKETKRPFLWLLHALTVGETIDPADCSKLVSAMEEIHSEFEDNPAVTIEGGIAFIKERHGVTGLYKDSLEKARDDDGTDDDGTDDDGTDDDGTDYDGTDDNDTGDDDTDDDDTGDADPQDCEMDNDDTDTESDDDTDDVDPQDAPTEGVKLGACVLHGKDAWLEMPDYSAPCVNIP